MVQKKKVSIKRKSKPKRKCVEWVTVKRRKPRGPTAYNVFVKQRFSTVDGKPTERIRKIASIWRSSKNTMTYDTKL